MANTDHRLLPLFRSRLFFATAAVYFILGWLLAFLPLTDYLGLEFSLVVGIVAGLLGGPLGVSLYHRRTRAENPERQLLLAAEIGAAPLWIETFLFHTAAVLFSLVGLAVSALWREPCAPFRGAGFFVLLPMISVAYSGAWGLTFAALLNRPRRARVLVVLFALATAVVSFLSFIDRPAVWVYNPFFGHFPGPIYDEAATPTLALVSYRLANLATAWLVVYLLAAVWGHRLRRLGRLVRPKPHTVLVVLLLLAVSLGINQARFKLGFDMDENHLQERLGGYLRTEHFDIHYPQRADVERQIRLIAANHEFYFSRIEKEFGFRYPHRITSWIYPNEATKKKLIGAGGTEYADCAKHHMHLNYEDFPHHILHHEMIHVMLSEYGLPVLGFSSSVVITEGIAVAFGGPRRWNRDVDRWAAGMKAIDRLPRIPRIMGVRFWQESGARAYVAAGSFIRFLAGKPDGVKKLLASYAWSNLEKHFGRPLAELESEWLDHLTGVEAALSEAEIEGARYRFGFKSIFEMRCPREVGRLLGEANRQAGKRYFQRADLLYQQAAELDRNNVRIARNRLTPLLRTGQYELAQKLARDISAAQGTTTTPALDRKGRIVGSQIIAQRADLILAAFAWKNGDRQQARSFYTHVVEADLLDSLVREAACALYAMDHDEIESEVREYFTDFSSRRAGYWRLLQSWRDHQDDPVVAYLTARRMLADEAYADAATYLRQALQLGLPHRALTHATWFALGYAEFLRHDLASARDAFENLLRLQADDDAAVTTREWLDRIDAWPDLLRKIH